MKKILAFALCTIVVLQLVVVSFAHDERSTVFHVKTCTDYKGRTCIGGEEFGFMIHMNQYAGHPTTFNLTYSFDLTQYTESDLVGPYDEKVHLDTMNDDIKSNVSQGGGTMECSDCEWSEDNQFERSRIQRRHYCEKHGKYS